MKKTGLIAIITLFNCVFLFVSANDYSIEFTNAYNYAYNKGITTISPIEKAQMYGNMTRIEMAKMISNFAINVLGLNPDNSLDCSFYDVSSDLDKQYSYGVTQACQLGLMGIYDDGGKADYFNPSNEVTRGEWATVFSRVLNKSQGTNIVNGDPFYKTHLNYLISKGIINNYSNPSPNSAEKRGNVMLMMYRADQNNIVTVDYEIGYTKLDPGQTYYNTFYGFQIECSGNYPWIVKISSGGYGIVAGYYSFIPKKYGDFELAPGYINEYEETAKSFNQTGLLLSIEVWELIKKGTKEYEEIVSYYLEDDGDYNPDKIITTSKSYVIDNGPGSWIQESPYEYKGKKEIDAYGTRHALWELIGKHEIIYK